MFNWPFDHPVTVFVLFAAAAAVLAVLWMRTGNRRVAQALAAVGGLLVLFLLVWLVWETPSQQVKRKLKEMATAVKARKEADVVKHVSDDFERPPYLTKASLPGQIRNAFETGLLEEVSVWDFSEVEFPRPAEGAKPTARVTFSFKAKGNWGETVPHWHWTAIFARDGDGQWRLKDFERPVSSLNGQPIEVPQLGQ